MIRRGMDVFTLDGVYVGTVVHVATRPSPPYHGARPSPPNPLSRARERGSLRVNQFSGESLGPVPTARIGNRGPSTQARVAGFGAVTDPGAPSHTGPSGHLVIFRWLVAQQWRMSMPSLRRLPLNLVQTVSLERVILSVTTEELARR